MLQSCGRLAFCRSPRLSRFQSNARFASLSRCGDKTTNESLKMHAEGDLVIALDEAIEANSDDHTQGSQHVKKRRTKSKSPPARLQAPGTNDNHHDLASFLDYATRVDLSHSSTVYTGTHYEYTVAESLKEFRFELHRSGRSNDLGIDLVGEWKLPARSKDLSPMKVLIQCKAVNPTPSMVRELEGVYAGAPVGWDGSDALALLVANQKSTKGVREALQRSTRPMGFLQITREGEVKQLTWNYTAAQSGLGHLGVTSIYGGQRNAIEHSRSPSASLTMPTTMALTWKGKLWPAAKS